MTILHLNVSRNKILWYSLKATQAILTSITMAEKGTRRFNADGCDPMPVAPPLPSSQAALHAAC
jgi:hypothetical protein